METVETGPRGNSASPGAAAGAAGSGTGQETAPTSLARPPRKERSVTTRTGSTSSELANKFAGINFQGNEVFQGNACPSSGSGSKLFPPAYNIIRAGKAMKLNMSRLGSVTGFDRIPSKIGYGRAGIAAAGDGRALCAQNYHCIEKGLNMSLSIGKPGAGGG